MGKTRPATLRRLRRKLHIRKTIHGTAVRPRLSVFRSLNHIYAQLIDDDAGVTLASACSLKQNDVEGDKKQLAKKVGKFLGDKAREAGIESVVFDRNGYLYHGRVKALAEGAREAGLKF